MQKITIVRVGKEHIDQYGHVNYENFPKLLEAGQDDYMEHVVGVDFEEIERRWGLRSFVKALHITYGGQAREGDDLSINTGIESVGTTSFTFAQTMKVNESVICGSTLTVVIVSQNGKPIPIPYDLRKLFKPFYASP